MRCVGVQKEGQGTSEGVEMGAIPFSVQAETDY